MNPADPTATHAPQLPADPSEADWDAGLAAAFGLPEKQPRPAVAEPEVGAVLAGKYRLTERIGEGGMGSVWVAQQTEPVKRRVAIKLIKAGMDSKSVLARFEAERQALAVMDHPNIAKVLDGGLHDGRPFFVMELVKGVPITDYCDARKLTPRERLELFLPVCHAIQHAHQKGIIHRDIKPSNVLIALYDDRPVPKVIDFGVAKATGAALTEHTIETAFGGVIGTPQYMSPEQATLNNLDIDTRSDVYSLGVLLYELLTGSPPFARKDLEQHGLLEMLRVVREVEPPKPSTKLSTAAALPTLAANRGTEPGKLTKLLRSELDWIILKALEKDRSRRYETANGFAADIHRYLDGEPVLAHPPGARYRIRKLVRRNRPQVIAAGLVLLALVAGVIGTTWGLFEANRARMAERNRAEGERLAKIEAVATAVNERQARAQEQAARDQSDKRRQHVESANQVLAAIFRDLNVNALRDQAIPLEGMLAVRLHEAAKNLDGDAFGDPETGALLSVNLASALASMGYFQDAIPILVKSRETLLAVRGPNDLMTAICSNNLAMAYRETGQPALAIPLAEDVLRIQNLTHPEGDHGTASALKTLGSCYLDAGEVDRAEEAVRRAHRLFEKLHGPNDPSTLLARVDIAICHAHRNRRDLALPIYQEVYSAFKKLYGPEHMHTVIAMVNVATCTMQMDNAAQAIPILEEANKWVKVRHIAGHAIRVKCAQELVNAYIAVGDAEKLQKVVAAFVQETRDNMIPGSPQSVHNLVLNLISSATSLVHVKQFASAESYAREALTLKDRSTPDAWAAAQATALLGTALLGQKKYTEAGPLLVRGYEDMLAAAESKSPDNRVHLAETLDRLIELHTATNRSDDLKKWRTARASYPDLAPNPRRIK